MIFAIVYKSHNHWSVHVPLVLSYTSFPIQPNLHAYCCLSPWKHSFWGLASQGGSGFQLMWLILRVVSASAQNCKRNPWSSWNEAQSRGLFLRGKRKTHQTGPMPLSYNQYLELHLETRAELIQVLAGHGKTPFTHHYSQLASSARQKNLFIDIAQARCKRYNEKFNGMGLNEKFNGMGLSPNQKILICHYMSLSL